MYRICNNMVYGREINSVVGEILVDMGWDVNTEMVVTQDLTFLGGLAKLDGPILYEIV